MKKIPDIGSYFDMIIKIFEDAFSKGWLWIVIAAVVVLGIIILVMSH